MASNYIAGDYLNTVWNSAIWKVITVDGNNIEMLEVLNYAGRPVVTTPVRATLPNGQLKKIYTRIRSKKKRSIIKYSRFSRL